MKAIVLSDSHHDFNSIIHVIENESHIDLLIHAGDVQRDVDDIQAAWPNIPCAYVVGNNDFFVRDVPTQRIFTFAGKKIFLTHGHLFGVKSSLSRLEKAAVECHADICIFGHTHLKHLEKKDGLWILNPGSSCRSYAVIEIKENNINIKIKETP